MPLIEAIIKGEAERVRQLIESQPVLMHKRSESGRLPLEVAKASGHVNIEVVLHIANAPGQKRSEKELLLEYMYELSSDLYCAHWIGGLGEKLWSVVMDNSIIDDENICILSLQEREDIRNLSEKCNGWWEWNDNVPQPRFYTLDEWRRTINLKKSF